MAGWDLLIKVQTFEQHEVRHTESAHGKTDKVIKEYATCSCSTCFWK